MKIAVAVKVVPDDQDIQVAGDGSLDFSKAHQRISEYDLNAIEAAAQLAAANGGQVVAISVGGAKVDDSKVKKDILSRGVDELYMTAGDAAGDLDSAATAAELAKLAERVGGVDLIVCGAGSADLYAKQTGVQLAAAMGLPYVSGVVEVAAGGAGLTIKRVLESVAENVEVTLPCVISVLPDCATPRIAGIPSPLRSRLTASARSSKMSTRSPLPCAPLCKKG